LKNTLALTSLLKKSSQLRKNRQYKEQRRQKTLNTESSIVQKEISELQNTLQKLKENETKISEDISGCLKTNHL
jgi:hypothetical protein